MDALDRRFFLSGLAGAATFPLLPATAGARRIPMLDLRADDAATRLAPPRAPGSHVKVYVPNFPYIYTSHAISAGLIRPARNARGWEYDLAESIDRRDTFTYEVTIRPNLRFQDGAPFTADSIILNTEYFLREPFQFSGIHTALTRAEKIDDARVRFVLNRQYGAFMQDLIWFHFYTPAYLARHGWAGRAWCPNLAEPGPHSLGPFILTEGYIQGDRKTAKAELEANPHYWRPDEPKVRRVTVYTEYDHAALLTDALNTERKLDIAPIPFDAKARTIMSPHAKVVTTPTNNNFSVQFNALNGHPKLRDARVRVALNRAIDQASLLNFVYEGEGQIKSTLVVPSFTGMAQPAAALPPHSALQSPRDPAIKAELRDILSGLVLTVVAHEALAWVWRGIEYQLNEVGVTLNYRFTNNETDVFAALFSIKADTPPTRPWDLLMLGWDDWYFNHIWTVLLLYHTAGSWSTLAPDPEMDGLVDALFAVDMGSDAYIDIAGKAMARARAQGYTLGLPGPNGVFAVNKEVAFTPWRVATAGLWDVQVTTDHWSVRAGDLPEERKRPIDITRM